jgi:hypothetical protein
MAKLAQSPQADKQRMRLDSDADDLGDSPFAAF